jgi:hypothetical protein
MKSLITALGLAFAFATVAPTIASLPFSAAPAFASKGHDSSADGGRHDGKSDAGRQDGKSDVASHDGKSDVSSHDGKSDVSGSDGKDVNSAHDSQIGIDDSNDSGR